MPAMTEQQLAYNLPFEFHDFLTEEKELRIFLELVPCGRFA